MLDIIGSQAAAPWINWDVRATPILRRPRRVFHVLARLTVRVLDPGLGLRRVRTVGQLAARLRDSVRGNSRPLSPAWRLHAVPRLLTLDPRVHSMHSIDAGPASSTVCSCVTAKHIHVECYPAFLPVAAPSTSTKSFRNANTVREAVMCEG